MNFRAHVNDNPVWLDSSLVDAIGTKIMGIEFSESDPWIPVAALISMARQGLH